MKNTKMAEAIKKALGIEGYSKEQAKKFLETMKQVALRRALEKQMKAIVRAPKHD